MDIDTEGMVMFAHVALVVVGMMMAAVLHTGLIQMRRARSTAEMKPWVALIKRLEPLLPVFALGILGTGGWLVHLSGGEIKWGDAWVVTSLVGLFVAEGIGAALSSASHALTGAVAGAGDGPVDADLHHRTQAPALWYGSHFITAVFFGIIFLMTAKPTEPVVAVGTLVVAGLVGLGSAVPFVRHPEARAHPARLRRA